MRKYSLKLSLAGVLLLGGASLLASPLDYLKSLNLAPKTASLGKPEKIDIHSIPFLKYRWRFICLGFSEPANFLKYTRIVFSN